MIYNCRDNCITYTICRSKLIEYIEYYEPTFIDIKQGGNSSLLSAISMCYIFHLSQKCHILKIKNFKDIAEVFQLYNIIPGSKIINE